MGTRTANSSHLGERRFLEYPQFVAEELDLAGDAAQRLLARHTGTTRLAFGVALAALAAVAAALFLLLR